MDKELLKIERKKLSQELKENLSGKTITHSQLLQPVIFNWQGLKHCLSSTSIEPAKQFYALRQLPQLLVGARYSHYEPDSHTPPRTGVGIHILYASCDLIDDQYGVWLRVRETPDGLYFYDLGVVR